MAGDGSENSVAIRDERGRYLKGIAGGPGRPAGSRNKLTEEFLGDLHAAWHEHGREAIDRVVAERPEMFLAIVAKTIDVRRIEIGQPEEFSRRYTKEAIIEKIEQKAGEPANCSRSLLVMSRSWKRSRNRNRNKLCRGTASEIR